MEEKSDEVEVRKERRQEVLEVDDKVEVSVCVEWSGVWRCQAG